MYFAGADASGQIGLWVTNGTAAGTHELTVVGALTAGKGLDPSNLAVYDSEVLFNGVDASGKDGLWVWNGTSATELVAGAGGASDPSGLDPTDFTLYNGEVLFSGYDSSGHLELWETNGTAAGTQELSSGLGAPTGLAPFDLTSTVPATTPPPPPRSPSNFWVVTPNVLNNFSWAQGWNSSPDYFRDVVSTSTNPSGGADYVGFGTNHVTMSAGEATPNGPGFASSTSPIDDFGTAQGYTAAAQRGAADTGNAGATAPTVYGQGFAGVYWYDTTGGTSTNPTYQSTPNLYPDFGTHEGWTPANGFDVVKARKHRHLRLHSGLRRSRDRGRSAGLQPERLTRLVICDPVRRRKQFRLEIKPSTCAASSTTMAKRSTSITTG